MTKKVKSTIDELIDSMSPKEKVGFNDELKDFVISELILALMEQDNMSVRKLAKLAGVSPSVVQAMRSNTKKDFSMNSFFKVLKGLGCKKFMIEFNGQFIHLTMPTAKK